MRTTLLTVALLLAACGGSFPNAEQLSTTAPDAGSSPDAGDADAGPDAGLPAADAGVPPPDGGTAAQASPSLGGCPMFPAGSEWNRDVSGDAVDRSEEHTSELQSQ